MQSVHACPAERQRAKAALMHSGARASDGGSCGGRLKAHKPRIRLLSPSRAQLRDVAQRGIVRKISQGCFVVAIDRIFDSQPHKMLALCVLLIASAAAVHVPHSNGALLYGMSANVRPQKPLETQRRE